MTIVFLLLLLLTQTISTSPPTNVYIYDISYTNSLTSRNRFEHVHTVASIAGIVNKDSPKLFTPYLVTGGNVDGGSNADEIWYQHLTQEGEWLEHTTWHNITSLIELVTIFASELSHGVVLYDPLVPATSNLASTAAGTELLIPICYRPGIVGTVYSQLIEANTTTSLNKTTSLKITLDLTNKFSSKVNAYKWARARWLSPNSTNPANASVLAYYVDYWAAIQGDRLHATPGLTQVANHDYFIAHRGFFFDLSVWDDEVPVDAPNQTLGADKHELVAIFKAAYNATNGSSMIHVGGFTPWWYKYTSDGPGGTAVSKHKGVETEWKTMDVIGAYNVFDDADACCVGAMANSAFYQHYPLPDKLLQNKKPTVQDLHDRGDLLTKDGQVIVRPYSTFYAGDYDGAAWLYNQLKQNWDDPKRGSIPIGWAIDGELALRFPVIYKYLYATKTKNDWFISGDSGAGYLNPTLLFPNKTTGKRGESNITASGAPAWSKWNKKWYEKFDVSFSGFLINGDAGLFTNQSLEMYTEFSSSGVVISTEKDPHQTDLHTRYEKNNGAGWTLKDMPIMHHVGDFNANASDNAKYLKEMVNSDANQTDMQGKSSFYVLRTILKSAGYMSDTVDEVMKVIPNMKFIDPYTMGLLVQCDNGVINCTK